MIDEILAMFFYDVLFPHFVEVAAFVAVILAVVVVIAAAISIIPTDY